MGLNPNIALGVRSIVPSQAFAAAKEEARQRKMQEDQVAFQQKQQAFQERQMALTEQEQKLQQAGQIFTAIKTPEDYALALPKLQELGFDQEDGIGPQYNPMAIDFNLRKLTPMAQQLQQAKLQHDKDVLEFQKEQERRLAAPKPQEPFTLGPGQQRFDASGKPIASVPEKASANTNLSDNELLMLAIKGDKDAQAALEMKKKLGGMSEYQAAMLEQRIAERAQRAADRAQAAQDKVDAATAKESEQRNMIISNFERLRESAKGLREHPGLNGSVGTLSFEKYIPGTDASTFMGDLNVLKSQVAFNTLQALRDASKTGGALGNVSGPELLLLESNLGNLATNQSEAGMRNSLQKIEKYANEAIERIKNGLPAQKASVPTAAPKATHRFNPQTGKIEAKQ